MIPNRFHFVFGLRKQTEPFHLAYYLALESCRQVNRPEAIRFYYHYLPYGPYWDQIKPYLDLVKVDLDPFVQAFRYRKGQSSSFRYAHHADFIRLRKLVGEGGVYADIDTLFVRPLPARLFEKSFVMGRELDVGNQATGLVEPSLCNALMMSRANSEFGRHWLDRIQAEFDGSWSGHSTLLPHRLAEQHPDSIHIEPETSFFHFPATTKGLFALFEGDQPIPAQAYSLHLWAHLWWDQRRVDFSAFHQGLLNEDYIRQGGTTYSRAARPFLPERVGEPEQGRRFRYWTGVARQLWFEAVDDARALAGSVAFPAIRTVRPGFGRLHLARAHWAYRHAQRRFKVRHAFEDSILRAVIRWDEYDVFQHPFRPEDAVVDIGAHFGSFSYACHSLGCRNIHAFEPSADNFPRLRNHLGDLPGVTLHQSAVFRSDQPAGPLRHSGALDSNTGAGNVLFGGRVYDVEATEFAESQPSAVSTVPTISLDDILQPFTQVRLMKVDCEGSEFPILLTSKLLSKVERIVGEYHEIPAARMRDLTPEARIDGVEAYSGELLRDALVRAGYQVRIRPSGRGLGLFNAIRKG